MPSARTRRVRLCSCSDWPGVPRALSYAAFGVPRVAFSVQCALDHLADRHGLLVWPHGGEAEQIGNRLIAVVFCGFLQDEPGSGHRVEQGG